MRLARFTRDLERLLNQHGIAAQLQAPDWLIAALLVESLRSVKRVRKLLIRRQSKK